MNNAKSRVAFVTEKPIIDDYFDIEDVIIINWEWRFMTFFENSNFEHLVK